MSATLPDINTLLQAGINPKTGLPYKIDDKKNQKKEIKQMLRIIDEQDAVNRYIWYNLPCNITSQELERMLYYKGQLCFFYMEDLGEFYFMPYALDGTIDFYGRFNTIHPIPMTSGTDDSTGKAQASLLSNIKLKCVYGVKMPEQLQYEDLTNSAVLIHDYTKQLPQQITPRVYVNEAIIDSMADCASFMQTSLLAGTGILGVRVPDEDSKSSVVEGARVVYDAAIKGDPYVPIVGAIDFQELSGNSLKPAADYMQAMQSLDNLRLSSYGLDNGGLFEKKAHILNAENAINQSNVGLVMQDGLSIRQNFCNIVNSIWNIGMWCVPSENETMLDENGDGKIYDSNEDSSKSGVAYSTEGVEEDE